MAFWAGCFHFAANYFFLWAKIDGSQPSNNTVWLGCLLGVLLFVGAAFQQISLKYTSVANVAFITSLYVIFVPVIGLFLGYRYKSIVWLGGVIAITGLYLMTVASSDIKLKGDIYACAGAIFWALHLLILAIKSDKHPKLKLAFYQVGMCALLSLFMAYFFESVIVPKEVEAYCWLILSGVVVVGITYTLQVLVM